MAEREAPGPDGVVTLDPPERLLALTVPGLLALRARRFPTALALSARSAQGWRDRLDYAQLVDRMEQMALALARLGLGPGGIVALLLTNDAGRECFLTALGCLRLGAAVSPINTRASDEDLGHALALLAPAIVVTRAEAGRVARLHPAARILLVDGAAEGHQSWPDPFERQGDAAGLPPPPTDPGTLGCLLFTSGTTARPKAVMHSHASMIGAGLCCSAALGLRPGDLYQGGWPFFTSSGLNLGGMSAWVAGAGLVFESVLDNAGRLALIAQERSTFYHGVPSVILFMIDEFARGAYDVASLRRIGYGGAAMPEPLVRRIAAQWPEVEQVEIFGMTETGPTGTVLPPELRMTHFGSIGRAMPWCEVEVIDEAGDPLPRGTSGELFVRSPGLAKGYYRDPAATAAAFIRGGMRTGDVARIDEDGLIYYEDRKKDVINRGGLKIASVAVEEVLFRHPSVREVAVIAIPHPALGEDVAACVVLAEGQAASAEDLARWCEGRLADNARPRHWRFLPALPKNPMGKVLKRELRQEFAAG